MPPAHANFHALLIGINQYANSRELDTLRGCVNDVENMARILHERFSLPPQNIHTLTDADATHAAIKAAFRSRLIEPAQAWDEAGRADPPPAFLFYFSGHGSQAIDETGTEPDGMDETLVPHDSRTDGIYDIKDWELGLLLEELTAVSENVTVILDCCHSGSGTRGEIDSSLARARVCPPDLRPQPSQRPPARRTRSVTPSNWELTGRHVLLAGCKDKEKSQEHPVSDGDSAHWRGALSYFLQREVEEMETGRPLLYRELYERVKKRVQKLYDDQTPQCEGDLNREVFGGLRPQRDPFFNVTDVLGGDVFQIDGGAVHGLSDGSLVRVYPPEVRTLADAGDPLLMAEIIKCQAVTSWCERRGDGADAPLHGRAVLHRYNYGNMRRRVLFAIGDPALRQALLARVGPQQDITKTDISAYVEPITDGVGDFRVATNRDRLEIQNSAGEPLVAPFPLDDLDGLAADLAHIVRYHNGLDLRNPVSESRLAGGISLKLFRLGFDDAGQPHLHELDRRAGSELVAEAGSRFVFEITNHTDRPLYFALFDFSPDWEVMQMYPELDGAHTPLAANSSFRFGMAHRPWEPVLESQLPAGLAEGKDTFKVIASVQDTNFEALRMKALKLPHQPRTARGVDDGDPSLLDQLLAQALSGGNTRAWGTGQARVEDDWTTAELAVTTIQSARSVSRGLVGGTEVDVPFYPLRLTAPDGFQGTVRVLTPRQSTRSADGSLTEFVEAPGLAAMPELFQPLRLASTRSAGASGAVVEIDAEGAARALVTPQTPLTLALDAQLAGTDPLLAVGFDGSFFYPVGRSDPADANRLAVEWLPEPDPQEPLRLQRSLGRTVKLYLYRLAGRQHPSLGLHRVRYVPGDRADQHPPHGDEVVREVPGGLVYYGPADGALQPGMRAAVVVHGFSAESRWMAAWVAGLKARIGLGYDAVLAFDYETFATAVQDNAAALGDALATAGAGPQDQVQLDVFAHSQGTLVTRALVELLGGRQFIDRCFLAAPPNRGTRLAEAKRLAPWLATLALNQIVPGGASGILGWALKKVADDGAGAEDLRPGSQLLNLLENASPNGSVPYFVLAGDNSQAAAASGWLERLQRQVLRGVDVGLDALFGGQHDLVIALKSMTALSESGYPAHLLHSATVTCDHFRYFAADDAQQQLYDWLEF